MALTDPMVENVQSSKLSNAVAAALLRSSDRYDNRAEANAADSSLANDVLTRSKRANISFGLQAVCGRSAAAA